MLSVIIDKIKTVKISFFSSATQAGGIFDGLYLRYQIRIRMVSANCDTQKWYIDKNVCSLDEM